jgi:hypothetical protein
MCFKKILIGKWQALVCAEMTPWKRVFGAGILCVRFQFGIGI